MSITNGYATLVQVKSAARITDTAVDDLLEMSVETASRMIDAYCGRRFWTNGTETRYYATHDRFFVSVDDLAGTAVTVETSTGLDGVYDVTWDPALDFQLEPLNGNQYGVQVPYTRIRAIGSYLFTTFRADTRASDGYYAGTGEETIKVTGVFGYGTAVPTEVSHATILLALRQYKRYESPTGVLGFGDFGPMRVGSKMDPDVAMILNRFRRVTVGAA